MTGKNKTLLWISTDTHYKIKVMSAQRKTSMNKLVTLAVNKLENERTY